MAERSLYEMTSKLYSCKNRDEMTRYFDSTPFVAKFLKRGNVVSEEVCRLEVTSIDNDKTSILVSIGDGNHSDDFDSVDVVDNNDNIAIFRLFYTYRQFRQGYGTLEVTVTF